jgi:hypothetical protein
MSADFKLCIKCDKLVNILDDHDDCYHHRVCNSEFPCEICKSWTSEKRQSVKRMINKARLAATKKQSRSTDVETCPSIPPTGTRQVVASSLLTRVDNKNNQSSYRDSNHPKSSYEDRSHTKSSCGDRGLPK